MAVQAVFMNSVHCVRSLRYTWAEDGTVLLTLDCHPHGPTAPIMTFGDLSRELRSLCSWQLSQNIVVGLKHALSEIVTLYHAFECAPKSHDTLMLIATPPDEYFEAIAA
ncbi:MAG: hypothetical protein JOZ62_23640 [Acidobacteriaceae bacterium]|nr:hypothetical protein [Acidobacteriaceae bacterium]